MKRTAIFGVGVLAGSVLIALVLIFLLVFLANLIVTNQAPISADAIIILEVVWLEFGKILYWELTPFMEFQGGEGRLRCKGIFTGMNRIHRMKIMKQ